MTIASPKLDPSKINIKPLVNKNCISNFSCGVNEIDNWANRKARSLHIKGRKRVFIAWHEDCATSLGFYSLSFSLENSSKLKEQADRQAWSKGAPLIYMDYIGVTTKRQGTGLGTLMLIDALKRTQSVSDNVAIFGIALRSLNSKTTTLYKNSGFGIAEGEGDYPLMIMPIWTIVDLFSQDKHPV